MTLYSMSLAEIASYDFADDFIYFYFGLMSDGVDFLLLKSQLMLNLKEIIQESGKQIPKQKKSKCEGCELKKILTHSRT